MKSFNIQSCYIKDSVLYANIGVHLKNCITYRRLTIDGDNLKIGAGSSIDKIENIKLSDAFINENLAMLKAEIIKLCD